MARTFYDRLYTTAQVARIGGMSRAMVHYLFKEEVLVPASVLEKKRGIYRFYTFDDVVFVAALGKLLERGIQVARLKQAIKAIQELYGKRKFDYEISEFLVTDGRNVYFQSRENVFENLSKGGQYEFAFVIPLRQIHDACVLEIKAMDREPKRASRVSGA